MIPDLPGFDSAKYCIDTNFLVDLWRRQYPPDIFSGLWKDIDKAFENGIIISTIEVHKELEDGSKKDELKIHMNTFKNLFVEIDSEQDKLAEEIINRYEKLVDYNKEGGGADPFVIALAEQRNLTVLTTEQLNNDFPHNSDKAKIPNVCKDRGIKYINSIPNFIREMGWKY